MSHWITVPILLPLFTGLLLLSGARWSLNVQRGLGLAATAALVPLAIALLAQADTGAYQVYALGDWPAPFGILLVLDRLSALLLVLTAVLALPTLLYAIRGSDAAGGNFHALFQLQLVGLNGAFLTGDLFNLFVFFEILLIASYALLLHGQGPARSRAGLHYVVLNLIGSSLFLFAVGTLYGLTGTLNMADLAARVAAAPAGDQGLIAAAALVLTTVFALKAALAPLHFWLPGAYAATSGAVAALFAIMTKVGAYAIIRTGTLIFGADAGAAAFIAGPWILPAAVATAFIGFIGLFAARDLREMAAWSVVGSMGVLLCAVSVFRVEAMGPALYYLLHSTLAAAALFLVVDQIARRRGEHGGALTLAPRFCQSGLLSGLFFLAAIGVVGLPPLSGFIGKLLILDGVRAAPGAGWIWATLLITTLIGVLAFSRAGSLLFWKTAAVEGEIPTRVLRGRKAGVATAAALLAGLAALTLLGGPVTAYTAATAAQLFEPQQYIAAVLGETAGGRR